MAMKIPVQKLFENLYQNDLIAMEVTLKGMTNILNEMKKVNSTDKENLEYYLTMMNYEETKFKKVLEGLSRQMTELL
ncbi:hypothetical protein CIRMBP1271_01530 [Enterococcus cecorum]|uniref:hypothetical protein n=1 Tax=Enterococcus cecorum TaxID=44008 RepID=UPI001D8640DF|nr:hypothetical protein [Enterococcus cecorum]CAI3277542.1 hypothetical protein CIRMBP1274_00345 [Enterococcus cecorum]CAI3299038.1 hypothetical protein CIRMBP1276_00532 [Enterococcus cecorum]CAI3310470.1 hypothetical protein CIRMBP1267_00628 [Enterococcus cecorum]CAI3389670.1 hypothetical protein CIRMBP1265_01524 [Enterococcus cecorum]CAI3393078.1 hypothetical protein CIRMBP1240_01543 [Enterococcus cecorum]